MILPPEFFSIAELQTLSGRKQRAGIKGWLNDSRIQHVTGLHGWPLVYRTGLLPQTTSEAKNDPVTFNFSAVHANSRKATRRCTP